MSEPATAEAMAEPNEDQLNKAIDELRGVLNEDGGSGAEASHAAMPTVDGNNVVMSIPVEVQIVLGSTEMPVSELMGLQ